MPAIFIIWFGLISSVSFAQSQESLRFTPDGSAKHVSQVRAHFSSPVAALGERSVPFTIVCDAVGEGRWVTTQDWIFDFKDELPVGKSCTYTLTLTKDLAGKAIIAENQYRFDTGGPQIIKVDPYQSEYNPIDEEQLFILELDSDVDENSLKSKLFFELPQIANPVPFKLLTREQIEKENPELGKSLKERSKPYLLVQADFRLPSDATIKLVWDKGIKTKNGVPSRERQVFSFKSRKPFTASVSCTRATSGSDCSPFDEIYIQFTATPAAENASIEGLAKDQKVDKSDADLWKIAGPHVPGGHYKFQFPREFKDDAGRSLNSNHDLSIKVGQYPPLIKFDGKFGILEAKASTKLPVHLRKVELDTKVRLLKIANNAAEIVKWHAKNLTSDHDKPLLPDNLSGRSEITLPRTNGHDAFEVRPIPLPEPGYYQLEISSAELGQAYALKPMYVHSQALVTDLAIHWKQTHDNALVWVTSLESGLPVPGVAISVYDCQVKNQASGTTGRDGSLLIQKHLNNSGCSKVWNGENEYGSEGFLVMASLGPDNSFLFSNENQGIESWRFGLDSDSWSPLQIHSVLDRSLLRAGETVSGLNFARLHSLKGFEFPSQNALDKTISFTHVGSGKRFTEKLSWDAMGRSKWTWKIPQDAALGSYEIMIDNKITGELWVREFKLATVKATLSAEDKRPVGLRKMSYNFDVSYLNGGSAGDLPTSFRGELQVAPLPQIEGFKDYIFNSGIRDSDEIEGEKKIEIKAIVGKLDAAGHGKATLEIPSLKVPMQLRAELEYPDSNGQLRTQVNVQIIHPAALLLGLSAPRSWPAAGSKQVFNGVLLDLDGKAYQGEVKVSRYKKNILSHRRRSIGGTYTYQHKVTLGDEVKVCDLMSNGDGRFECPIDVPEAGSYVVRAEAKDASGRIITTENELWASGSQYWYKADDNDRIDLIPEKKQYEPGETAKILIKAPFASGTILYTTEREGIEHYEVKTFNAKNPFIEVPIQRSFAPNIYVTAWLIRGRVKGTEPFLKVDLGKPAFKLGIVDIKVGWTKHNLSVSLKTDKTDYLPRDKVKLSIDVKSPNGVLPEGAMVTVAAVDEGLLEIEGNKTWDLLDAMMGHRGFTGSHATASLFVVGKRHFGLKSLPAGGGGGGKGNTRELFDTLLHWTALAPLVNGHADLEVPLNDSLTGFRLVAIAHAGPDLFGKGETTIHSSKDLSLFAGLPAMAREGDRYRAEITARNSSAKALEVTVSGTYGEGTALTAQKINLPAKSSKIVHWNVTIPSGITSLAYTFTAAAQDLSDEVKITQIIGIPVPQQTIISQIQQVDAPMDIALDLPGDAKSGAIKVSSQSPLSQSALDGVKLYMSNYPYNCLEQKLSRAIALGKRKAWDEAGVSSYFDGDGLLKFFPIREGHGSVELTAYVLELSFYQGWPLKDQDKAQMLQALNRFVKGQLVVRGHGLFMDEKLRALAALSLWNEETKDVLKGLDTQPHFLAFMALVDLYRIVSQDPEHPRRKEIEDALAERFEMRGTVLQVKAGGYSMLGSLDATLSRLLVSKINSTKDASDLPLLFRTLLSGQLRGHWDSTVGDALGSIAVQKFSEAFDKIKAQGPTHAALADKSLDLNQNEEAKSLPWPAGKGSVHIEHSGEGKPWVTVSGLAAIPLTKASFSGIKLEKTMTPVRSKKSGVNSVGDIYEVEIKFRSETQQDWTGLIDPVPAGARVLPGDSEATYTELGFQGMTAYFEWLYPGEHSFRYRFQINTVGEFVLPPTRMEALYAPEVFGMLPNPKWVTE